MMEEGTVGATIHYRPLGQQRSTNDNNETHLLDATISHVKGGRCRRIKGGCSGNNYEEDTSGSDWMMA